MSEFLEPSESLSVNETLEAIHVAGDLFLVALKECQEHQKRFPFIPDIDRLAVKVWETTGFGDLKPETKQVFAERFGNIFLLMEERAEYQQRWRRSPGVVKSEIISDIVQQIDISGRINPDNITIRWGLLSMVVVAKEIEFRRIMKVLVPIIDRKYATGFISGRLLGPLGEMSVVLDEGMKGVEETIRHEDIHKLQAIWGDLTSCLNLPEELEAPGLLRAIDDEGVLPEDLDVCLGFLSRVCDQAIVDDGVELRAYLWEKKLVPSSARSESSKMNPLTLGLLAVFNAVYASSSHLSEKEQVENCYSAIYDLFRVAYRQDIMVETMKEALKNYNGEGNRWDWVASRMMVLPVDSSPALARMVLLGRGRGLEKPPEINTSKILAQALIVHARRLFIPDSYGQGEMVSRERTQEFWDFLERIYKEREAYQEIFDQSNIEEEELKRELISYAKASVAKGMKGETERALEKRL